MSFFSLLTQFDLVIFNFPNVNDIILLNNNFNILRFTDDEVDEMYREAPIKGSMFDYIEFTRILKHGAKDKDEQ